MDAYELSLGFILGAFSGALALYFYLTHKQAQGLKPLKENLHQLNSELKVKKVKLEASQEQQEKLENQLKTSEHRVLELEKGMSSSEADKKNLREQVKKLESIESSLEKKMEQLLLQIHDQSHERMNKTSKESWVHMITPFKDEIQQLKKTVTETYEKESRDSLALKTQIEQMHGLYEKMTTNTESLTKALRGDSKTQGDWGEMILERLLETAGLTEGLEYTTQGKGLDLKTDQGARRKPDITLLLPGDRHVIIDSKVSLVAYDRYITAETSGEREVAGKELLDSMDNHINDLSKKDYASLYSLPCLDSVLMFIPNDGMFALAASLDRKIYSRALSKGVALVSPAFLLPSLRLVQNIWQREKQAKNNLKIAEEAGKLYDKFVGFMEDLKKIQESLGKADFATQEAFNKLSQGRGNMVSKIQNLKALGAKTKKELDIKTTDDHN